MQKTNQNSIESQHQDMVELLAKDGKDILNTLTPTKCHIMHMAMGVAGEAGELLDAVKKFTVYNKALDLDNVIEELGDIEFYMEGLRSRLAITREATLEHNVNKLLKGKNARYKEGVYSDKQAQERRDKQAQEQLELPLAVEETTIAPKLPKILILGYAGSGKDGAARVLNASLGLSFQSSSKAALDKAVWPWFQEYQSLLYADKEECFADRANYRDTWHEVIKAYNTPDKARLAKEILKESNIYVGMRCKEELAACIDQRLFDEIFWISAGTRLPEESTSSMSISLVELSNFWWVDNSKDRRHFIKELASLTRYLASKYVLKPNLLEDQYLLNLLDHEDVASTK